MHYDLPDSNVVGLKTSDVDADVSHDDDSSEMETALENVADLVCASWEVFGSDAEHWVVTDVDGKLVRLTVSVEVM